MHFTEFIIILSSCFSNNAFAFFGLGNSFRFLVRDVKVTAGYVNFNDDPFIETKWIEQPLDHFDENENRKWKMRYFENLHFWKEGGPIYLFIYGEGMASPFFISNGSVLTSLAEKTNGALFLNEHRYYGVSKPFENFNADNLKYLSSRQALADVANLLQDIKSIPKFNSSKVVVTGGSYAGNLAAWMKLLYPDLVDAAIASSAPVLAKTDFYEYLEQVRDDFEQHGTDGCVSRISEILNRYDKQFETHENIAQLKKEENICNDSDMTKLENKQYFFMDKITTFMYDAQYGSPEIIKEKCKELSKTFKILSIKEDETSSWNKREECFDYDFNKGVEYANTIDWLTAWIYQSCTEFGYFQTTSSTSQLFTKNIPVEFYSKWCVAAFGSDFDKNRTENGVIKTNKLFGGHKLNVTKVIFVNGGLDPWARIGILENVSDEAPAIVISEASHCNDLLEIPYDDHSELVRAQQYIKDLIINWIG